MRRGYQDEEAFVTRLQILARGGAVVMYCEGGRSRSGKLADEARPGIGRIALESGAPVVPVAILGSYQVRNWKRLQFPKVTVQYGDPLRFEVVDGLDAASSSRRPPTRSSSGSGSCTTSWRGSAGGALRRAARERGRRLRGSDQV